MSLRRGYRRVMDWLEEISMRLADTVVVNSQFTRRTVLQTFPSLRQQEPDSRTPEQQLPVLYPALDDVDRSSNGGGNDDTQPPKEPPLDCLAESVRTQKESGIAVGSRGVDYSRARRHCQQEPPPKQNSTRHCRRLRPAQRGKRRVPRRTRHTGPQAAAAQQRQQQVQVDFRLSVSDTERQHLLQTAAAVVYTPANEHFGIVPLEAMDAGTVVICVDSGGPVETVVDGVTGYLCAPTAAAFGAAIQRVLRDPAEAVAMGRAGRKHVRAKFGFERLCREWRDLTAATVREGQRRRRSAQTRYYRVVHPRTVLYLLEAAVALLVVGMLTWLLRATGVLEPRQSILGGVRTVWKDRRDEL